MGYPMFGGLKNHWDGHIDDLVVNGIGGSTILQKEGNELVGYFPEKYVKKDSFNGVFLEVRAKTGLVETYAMDTKMLTTERIRFSLPVGLWEALATRTDVALVSLYTRFTRRSDVFINTLMGTRDGVASFNVGTIFKNDTEAPKSVASFDDGSFTNFAEEAQFLFIANNGDTVLTVLIFCGTKTGWKIFMPDGGILDSSLESAMVAPGSPLYFLPKYTPSEAVALTFDDEGAVEVAEAKEEGPLIIPVYR